MPGGGSRPGEHRGGRQKGVPNKLTLAMRGEQFITSTKANDPISVDILENLMRVFMAIAKKYAPEPSENPPVLDGKPESESALLAWNMRLAHFERWAIHARDTAARLAPYETPTLRALAVSNMREADDDDDGLILHTVEEVRDHLITKGVPPDHFARALLGPPQTIVDIEEQEQEQKQKAAAEKAEIAWLNLPDNRTRPGRKQTRRLTQHRPGRAFEGTNGSSFSGRQRGQPHRATGTLPRYCRRQRQEQQAASTTTSTTQGWRHYRACAEAGEAEPCRRAIRRFGTTTDRTRWIASSGISWRWPC